MKVDNVYLKSPRSLFKFAEFVSINPDPPDPGCQLTVICYAFTHQVTSIIMTDWRENAIDAVYNN